MSRPLGGTAHDYGSDYCRVNECYKSVKRQIEEKDEHIAELEADVEHRTTELGKRNADKLRLQTKVKELEALLDKANPAIVQDLKACMDLHDRNGVLCALTSCRDCKYRVGASEELSACHIPEKDGE